MCFKGSKNYHLVCLNLDYDLLEGLNLTLGRHASCELLAFDVDHAYTLLMGSSVGLRMIQETIFGLPYQVEFNHRLLRLSSIIAYKVQTIMMGLSVGLKSSWFKQRPNKCVMQCNLHGPT